MLFDAKLFSCFDKFCQCGYKKVYQERIIANIGREKEVEKWVYIAILIISKFKSPKKHSVFQKKVSDKREKREKDVAQRIRIREKYEI